MTRPAPRRALPSVDAVLRAGRPSDAERDRFTRAVREVLTRARGLRTTGGAEAFAAEARALLVDRERRTLRRVLNATGVILQTNLGRAPLSPRVLAAMADAAGGGRARKDPPPRQRGRRHGPAPRVLSGLSRDLAALAREHTLAFIHDLGSGTLLDTSRYGLGRELTVPEAVREGADVVTFSGDKLLGGPQAGMAVGRQTRIDALRIHPLMRALRPDKITIAGLIATLETYRDGRAAEELPVWRMIAASPSEIRGRAEKGVRAPGAIGIR